jgi:hypothetical protein
MEMFESLFRLALVAGLLWFGWVLFVMLAGNGSPLRAGNGSALRAGRCLGCDRNLSRGEVVHCSDCLCPELVGVENVRAVADCSVCGLPFVLSDSHDCEGV